MGKLWSIILANHAGADMSSNVGLSTPRGSGTSGYVQRNLSHLKPRDSAQPYPKDYDTIKNRQRQPDKEILEHDRKREIEVKVSINAIKKVKSKKLESSYSVCGV